MTDKNQSAATDNTDHIATFLAELDAGEALEAFFQIRDRFKFHGTVFTDTDIHEQVIRNIETNWAFNDDEIVDAVASNVTDALAASPDFRVIMEDKMEEAGREVLDTTVEDLMSALDRQSPVVVLDGAWGSTAMLIGGFFDLNDAYSFALASAGRTITDVREDLKVDSEHEVIAEGCFPQEEITTVALEVEFKHGRTGSLRIPLNLDARRV